MFNDSTLASALFFSFSSHYFTLGEYLCVLSTLLSSSTGILMITFHSVVLFYRKKQTHTRKVTLKIAWWSERLYVSLCLLLFFCTLSLQLHLFCVFFSLHWHSVRLARVVFYPWSLLNALCHCRRALSSLPVNVSSIWLLISFFFFSSSALFSSTGTRRHQKVREKCSLARNCIALSSGLEMYAIIWNESASRFTFDACFFLSSSHFDLFFFSSLSFFLPPLITFFSFSRLILLTCFHFFFLHACESIIALIVVITIYSLLHLPCGVRLC